MTKSVMCIVNTQAQVETIVGKLPNVGVRKDDISVLFPNQTGTKDFAHEHSTKAPEGAVTGAGAGGALGGTLGLLVGLGALAIPGVGPFIAAGPLLATLSGVAAGAAVGGIGGALIGLGLPEIEAKRYEGKLKGGNILISVHAETSERQKSIIEVFKASNAEDICTTSVASVPRKEERHRTSA